MSPVHAPVRLTSPSRPRRVLRRRDYARRGLVVLVSGALVLTLVWLSSSGTLGGPDHVSAQLADAGGSLGSGADVKIRGVSEDAFTLPDHHTAVTLRTASDVMLGTNNDDGTFDGRCVPAP